MTFWYGSGSADPSLWLKDPDLDPTQDLDSDPTPDLAPDPGIFVNDLQDKKS